MKIFTSALVALSAVTGHKLYSSQEVATHLASGTLNKITQFNCFYSSTEEENLGTTFYLSDFDKMGRNKGDLTKGIPGTPALLRQGGRGDNAFVYKTCQGKYDMNSTWYDESSSRYDPLVASTCPGPNQALGNDTLSKGHAYWINNGSCTQSFGNPRFYV